MSAATHHRHGQPASAIVHRPDRRRVLITLPAFTLAAAAPPVADAQTSPVLSIGGAIKRPTRAGEAILDLAAIAAMAQRRIKTRTPWHSGEPEFTGPLLRDLLDAVGAEGRTLRMTALNDYRVDIPADDARQFDMIVAHQIDGRPITVRNKGPLFVMYPFDTRPELHNAIYLSRCIWQLRRIDVR
jgi:hypothetical protein